MLLAPAVHTLLGLQKMAGIIAKLQRQAERLQEQVPIACNSHKFIHIVALDPIVQNLFWPANLEKSIAPRK